jgi:hypothetical protein
VSSLNVANTSLATYRLTGGKLQIQAGPRPGAVTITYTVSDGRGGTATSPVSVFVTASAPTVNGVPMVLGAKQGQP